MTANCFAFGQTFERLPHYLFNKGVKKSEPDKNSKAQIRKLSNEEQRFTVAFLAQCCQEDPAQCGYGSIELGWRRHVRHKTGLRKHCQVFWMTD